MKPSALYCGMMMVVVVLVVGTVVDNNNIITEDDDDADDDDDVDRFHSFVCVCACVCAIHKMYFRFYTVIIGLAHSFPFSLML